MALESGGIDAQVEQRMDAYRNNPQQLQQRSKMSGSLLDLLALQKITSEKQAVARDMQMKMQQQPGTIAQQREQQAVQLAKQEMGSTLGELAGRTKGTLDQKQKMQQQNMQRIAKAQPQRPAGIAGLPGLAGMQPQPRRVPPPQTQGLAGARMAQAAAQGGPRRMAGGGIVSFQTGEKVSLSADQKAKARKIFGDRYERIMTSLSQMDANSPEAQAIISQLGPKVQSSPFGRTISNVFTPDSEDAERKRLEREVQNKYGLSAGLFGGFQQQSDEARKYAQDVASTFSMGSSSLSTDMLRKLAAAPFSGDLTADDITTLPQLPLAEEVEVASTEEETPPPPQNVQPETGNVFFLPAEQENFFEGIETSYEPVTPKEADKTALNASIAEMVKQAGQVPTRGDVTPLEVAPLEFVEAPYDAQGQEILRSLTARYAQDMQADPLAAMQAAGASSDAYFDRAGKAAIYKQQEADERALQAETLDPDRLKKLARMQTLAGGRRGAGGIGQAYVDAQLGQDTRRSAGLETLRGIQDTGVTTDTTIAGYGAQSRENAGSRAEARRAAGILGARGLLTDQENRALQQQTLQNQVNVLNKEYEQNVETGKYNAAREALIRQGQAAREVVEVNADDVNNQVKVNISVSEDENKARKAAVENKLEIAKKRSDERLELNRELFTNEIKLMELAEARAKSLSEMVTTQLSSSPLAMELQNKLRKLSKSENPVEYAETEAALKELERATIEELIRRHDFFADIYADVITLSQRIQQLRAQNTAVSSAPARMNPNTTTIETIEP